MEHDECARGRTRSDAGAAKLDGQMVWAQEIHLRAGRQSGHHILFGDWPPRSSVRKGTSRTLPCPFD